MGTLLRGQSVKCLCCSSLIPPLALICMFFILRSSFIAMDYQKLSRCNTIQSIQSYEPVHSVHIIQSNACKSNCDPSGRVALPRGIVSKTSDLERRSLWGSPLKVEKVVSKSLLAMPVGIKQKEIVDRIVKKFLPHDFTIMLFHYDGVVDEWKDLKWSSDAIHVAATDQTKWWFAKRFLHPDIVSEYNYIFLWDEDLGVENFHPKRYLSIIREEGLEISQPALGGSQLGVHHQITARGRRSKVHRRTYKFTGGTRCYENSTNPPCTGWVEMMAPVFSKESWRCVWHMIQNDLIHAWGLDMKLGYCAQGNRTLRVGVVDAEYIVHKGIPSLGGQDLEEASSEAPSTSSKSKSLQKHERANAQRSVSLKDRYRSKVRMRSYLEQNIFNRRWRRAVDQDKCWRDPYPQTTAIRKH